VVAGELRQAAQIHGDAAAVRHGGLTQLSGDHNLSGTANGSSPTSVSGTAFGEDGTVYAVYTRC
jgi:flagellar hook protein FlgE